MSKRTPRLTSFPCPDCDFTTPKREEVQLHRRAVHAKATAPRYTAEQMTMHASPAGVAMVERGSTVQRQGWIARSIDIARQAAETERALEAFRAELVRLRDAAREDIAKHEDKTRRHGWMMRSDAYAIALESFDRRFGRTP